MADRLNVEQKRLVDNFRSTHKECANLSDAEILSALVNLGQIQLSEEQKLSLFNNSTNNNSGMGLQLEHSANPTNNQSETIFLQSGRKIVITKTQDGKDLYKYYSADGTQLKPDYFKQQEGVVRVSANRKTYTVTKNGNTIVKKAKDPLMAKIDQQQAELNKTKKEQGFIGKSWDWFKNKTGIGDGSDKAQKQLDAERKLVQQIQNGKINKNDFKNVTGLEYSKENLQKFKNGEIELKSTEKVKGYQEGQDMACDVAGDIISGIAAVGIYSLAVAAAPFTGGASIAVGVGAAALSGAAIKTGIKALDATTGGRKYSLKDLGHDSATGAFSGLLAPITGGMGGAVGKTVATKLGVQAVKTVGKEVAETVVETGVKQGVKQGLKTALINPTGYEYVGGTFAKRALSMSAEMATDGALGGAIDGGFRAGLDNDWDANAIISGTVEGGIGGALMAPIIGGGFKAVGKGGHKLGEKIKGSKEASEAVEGAIEKEIADAAEVTSTTHTKTNDITSNAKSEETAKVGNKKAYQKPELKEKSLVPEEDLMAGKSKPLTPKNAKNIPSNIDEIFVDIKKMGGQDIPDDQKAFFKELYDRYPDILLLFEKNKNGEFLYSIKTVGSMIEGMAENPEFNFNKCFTIAKNLNDARYIDIDDFNFDQDFCRLFEKIDAENQDNMINLIPHLHSITEGGKRRLTIDDVKALTNNFEYFKLLNQDEYISKSDLVEIINRDRWNETSGKIEFYNFICNNINILPEQRTDILKKVSYCSNIIDFTKKLCDDADFPKDKIADMLGIAHWNNIELADVLISDKTHNLPLNSIIEILEHTNHHNQSFIKNLCLNKDLECPKELIAAFAQGTDRLISNENSSIDLAYKLFIDKKDYNYPPQLISDILSATHSYNTKLVQKLFTDKQINFPKEKIANIVRNVYDYNYDFIEQLCIDKELDFPKNSIANIAHFTSRENISFAKKLCYTKDIKIERKNISAVLQYTDSKNLRLAELLCMQDNKDFTNDTINKILNTTSKKGRGDELYAIKLCSEYKKMEIVPNQIPLLLSNYETISVKQLNKVNKILGRDVVSKLTDEDIRIACQFIDVKDVTNINEMPAHSKKDFLKALVASNADLFNISDDMKKMFPMIPTNQEDYCSMLPAIVRSLGIETNTLNTAQVTKFNKSMNELSELLAKISDIDFANLHITQTYPREDFIQTVLQKTKGLSNNERQKVFDYFGFELKKNDTNPTGYTIYGYPVNLNNGKKLAQITKSETKEVVESLRGDVIRFSQNNPITCENTTVAKMLNDIVEALPELRTAIGNTQHGNRSYSILPDRSLITRELKNNQTFKEISFLLKSMSQDELEALSVDNNGRIIQSSNKQLELLLNKLAKEVPSIKDKICIKKFGAHDFDVIKHSLKVMQKISQDPKFKELNESDKKIMMLASLLHDITKPEGLADGFHATNSSFDAFFIAKKFNLTKDEEIKLYTLIRHHEWLGHVNTAKTEDETIRRMQSVAYDLRHDNLFDMSLIFTHADLIAVRKKINSVIEKYSAAADEFAPKIRDYINELKKSQPLLPVTKMPRTNRIKQAITHVNTDGSTNIKGVYQDKDGLLIIKFNEVEDWEALGLPKGSISKGIKANGDVDTGNIHFFVHGLDYVNQLVKFDAFGMIDSDVLLSVSYAERPESKFRFFRTQGVLLDIPTKFVHGGGNTDMGSGCGKFVSEFKNNYIFGGARESDRLYISNMVKEATGMNDDEYIKFIEKYENKPFTDIYPEDLRNKIIQIFAEINSSIRKNGERSYNEMYGSNPSDVMGVFGYPEDLQGNIGDNIFDFVKNNDKLNGFLRQYALERDIPMYIFGY